MSIVEQALKSAIQFIESTVVLTDSQNKITQDTLAQCKAALAELAKCESETSSQPVATIYNGIAYWIGKEPPEGTNLFTTPQKQQPLKRLSEEQILKIGKNLATMLPNPNIDLDYANAIMDEIERINK